MATEEILRHLGQVVNCYPVCPPGLERDYGILSENNFKPFRIIYIGSSRNRDRNLTPTNSFLHDLIPAHMKPDFTTQIETQYLAHRDFQSSSLFMGEAGTFGTGYDVRMATQAKTFENKTVVITKRKMYSVFLESECFKNMVWMAANHILEVLKEHASGKRLMFGVVTAVQTGNMEILSLEHAENRAHIRVTEEAGLAFHQEGCKSLYEHGRGVVGVRMKCYIVENNPVKSFDRFHFTSPFTSDTFDANKFNDAIKYIHAKGLVRYLRKGSKDFTVEKTVEQPAVQTLYDALRQRRNDIQEAVPESSVPQSDTVDANEGFVSANQSVASRNDIQEAVPLTTVQETTVPQSDTADATISANQSIASLPVAEVTVIDDHSFDVEQVSPSQTSALNSSDAQMAQQVVQQRAQAQQQVAQQQQQAQQVPVQQQAPAQPQQVPTQQPVAPQAPPQAPA